MRSEDIASLITSKLDLHRETLNTNILSCNKELSQKYKKLGGLTKQMLKLQKTLQTLPEQQKLETIEDQFASFSNQQVVRYDNNPTFIKITKAIYNKYFAGNVVINTLFKDVLDKNILISVDDICNKFTNPLTQMLQIPQDFIKVISGLNWTFKPWTSMIKPIQTNIETKNSKPKKQEDIHEEKTQGSIAAQLAFFNKKKQNTLLALCYQD